MMQWFDAMLEANDVRGLQAKLGCWKFPTSYPEYKRYVETLGAREAALTAALERIYEARASKDFRALKHEREAWRRRRRQLL